MKIVMFSYLDELSGDGCRVITALLKAEGHQVKSVFMPFFGAHPGESEWVPELQEILEQADLFMMSVLSCYESRAAEVTRYLKKYFPDKLVVWGGVHATALTAACLDHADYVMRGECEESTVELCRRFEAGEDLRTTPNLAYRDEQGQLVQNCLAPLPHDLDRYPFPDYDLEDHFVLDGSKIVPANMELYGKLHATQPGSVNTPAYYIITTRGCPFVCTYCHQSEIVKTYPTKEFRSRTLRYKSVQRTIEEAVFQLARLPFIDEVCFSDDDFFCRKLESIREFAELYPREIGRPFGVAAIPVSIKEEKLKLLLDSGLNKIQIGVQSGSDRLNAQVYERRISKPKLLEAFELLDRYREHYDFDVYVDWIIDCPWETQEDVKESLDLALQLPKWAVFNIFTLTFYPGTVIWDRAVQEGIIDPRDNCYEQAFNMLKAEGHSYLTHVFLLHGRLRMGLPYWIVRMLASKPARLLGERLPGWILNGVWRKRLFPKVFKLLNRDRRHKAVGGARAAT